jgi:hypothetical protein
MQQFISNHSLEALGQRKVYLYALSTPTQLS